MNNIRLSKIKVPKLFLDCDIDNKKVERKINLIEKGGTPVVTLRDNNTIYDGYAAYLAYKQLGYKYIPFIRQGHRSNRELIILRANNICYICGRKMPDKELTLDHMKPRALGGENDESNLKCCCLLCNNLKGQLSYSTELRVIIRKELIMRGIQVV